MFLIFTTLLYQCLVCFLFALFIDEPEVFLPKYSQMAILHAAHFRKVVNTLHNSHPPLQKIIRKTNLCLAIVCTMCQFRRISLRIVYLCSDWSVLHGRGEQVESWFLCVTSLLHQISVSYNAEVSLVLEHI